MPEPDPVQEISRLLQTARDKMHRQRFFGAIADFTIAEQIILAQVPPDLRDGADAPAGPGPLRAAALGRGLFDAGARLQLRATAVPAAAPAAAGLPLPALRQEPALPRFLNARERLVAETLAEDERRRAAPVPLRALAGPAPQDDFAAAVERIAAGVGRLGLVPLRARLRTEDIPAHLGPIYFADIPLGIGDSLVQLGQDYGRAVEYYARAESYPFTNPPFRTEDLWLRLAEVFVSRGDAAYRSGDTDAARADYEQVIRQGDVPADARPYSGSLSGMIPRARAWIAAVGTEPANSIPASFPPRHVALIATVMQRLAQLDAGLDFLGEKKGSRPIFSFTYLREIARGFAQFAAQANREYISFTQRAEDETQNVQQLEQAVALADAGVEVERSRLRETQSELAAAQAAQRLAEERANLAQQNAEHFATVGWDIARLDEASAWAGAASGPHDDEMQLIYTGLSELGVSGEQRARSDLIHLLAWQRARRSYEIEVARLRRAASELREARQAAIAQNAVAQSRITTAQTGVAAARWRSHFARVNLATAQGRETSAELFFDLGRLVKETARIYLQRAIGAARAMEAAYNFENNTAIQRVRLDYGDLGGAGTLFAADFLLRDIDAFLFDHITTTRSKSQLVIQRLSLRREYPLQFAQFLRTGEMIFQTTLDQFHGEMVEGRFRGAMPGVYNARIKRLMVDVSGLSGAHGSLTCAGVSGVRGQNGGRIDKVHPAETMIIPPLTPEKALARLDTVSSASAASGELAVFENVGLACSWKMSIPLRSNDIFLTSASDVSLVFAYLCQHDPGLEAADAAALPPTDEAELAFDLRVLGRDPANNPVFGQLERTGEAVFVLAPQILPRHAAMTRIRALSVVCILKDGTPLPLTLRFSNTGGAGNPAQVYRPDADNVTRVAPLGGATSFHGTVVAGNYRVAISAADNPSLTPNAADRQLDLSGLHEITIIFHYEYDFR